MGRQSTQTGQEQSAAVPCAHLIPALEAIGTCAYVVDEQGRIIAANSSVEDLLDRPADELVGQDAHDLLHRGCKGQQPPPTQCSMRQAFRAGKPAQGGDEYFERADGSLLPISWTVTPYRIGGTRSGTLVVFHLRGHAPALGPRPHRAAGTLTDFERLALLAETTTQLTSTLDAEEVLRRLVGLVLPRLADWAVIDLITERDEVRRAAVVQADGDALVPHEKLEGPMPPIPEESPMPLARALRGVASALAGPETYRGAPDSGITAEQRRLFETTGIRSAAIVPIRSPRDVLGALTLGRASHPGAFTVDDLPLVEDIARRAAVALDNAHLYQRQRKVAETMQNHLLPQMPHVPGLQMTVRYLPAPDASQVGGDWYDAFTLPDGATALAVGDVAGHDLEAAAGMAQLRNMLRAYAWSQLQSPSRVVARLDEAIMPITDVTMATLVLARVTQNGDGHWQLSWTNAGHPPPLLITRDGLAHYLTDGHGLLLGTGARIPRADATVMLPPGCTLLLYTDGLIEKPGHTLDDGLTRLRKHAAALAHRPPALLHRPTPAPRPATRPRRRRPPRPAQPLEPPHPAGPLSGDPSAPDAVPSGQPKALRRARLPARDFVGHWTRYRTSEEFGNVEWSFEGRPDAGVPWGGLRDHWDDSRRAVANRR